MGGAEKLTDVSEDVARDITSSTSDQEWETFFGVTQASQYALIANKHMNTYNTKREAMAEVAVKNHYHGSMNSTAHFQNKITVEAVLKSPPVSTPLGMLDCAPLSDGAATVILAPLDIARKFTDTPIKIQASTISTDTATLFHRRDICTFDSTILASKKAYDLAGIGSSQLDLVELNDNYTISEIIAIEDLNITKKGEAGKELLNGRYRIGDKPSINTSGGLKAHGQPYGAVGIAQIVEIVKQLTGRAEKRTVNGAEIGLTHTIGGIGSVSVINILKRVN